MTDTDHTATATPAGQDVASEDLVSALDVIEQQPLADRAAGYLRLHDELTRRLDASA